MARPVAVSVVKVLSLPYRVPAALTATMRKWYVVLGLKLLMLALMFRYVFSLWLWGAVVNP
jgi:hypothetical protein